MRRRGLRHAVVEIDEMLAVWRDGESVEPRGSNASFEEHRPPRSLLLLPLLG